MLLILFINSLEIVFSVDLFEQINIFAIISSNLAIYLKYGVNSINDWGGVKSESERVELPLSVNYSLVIWENVSNCHHNIHVNPNLLHIMPFTWMNSISFNPDFIKFSVLFTTKHYLHERLEFSMLIMNTLRPTVKFHPQKENSLNIYWKRMAHDLIQINMKIFIIWLCDAHFAVDGSAGLNVRYSGF